ncbi:MAG: CBM50, partial [uncultured Thermomicrobiales bacterium]
MGVGLRVAMLGEWRHVAAVAILVLAFAPWSMLWPASVAAEPYLVQPGDTLSGIAAAYGVPLDDLATANDITELDVLFAGDVLFVPEYGVATVPIGYTVREGDTLEEVAALLGTSLPRLLAANPAIVDPDSIAVGQTLRVPGFGDDDVVLP